ncbi:hypothetical protein K469DRAFT_755633 [Zopfia rhizophila CBS 207.26]|uniref:Uncharacterized protein n=1 Tax=Zopfia rhizophila CBS 207.26 TaxID=1314779 RepID=A0A6A6DAF5_9PEZI|nr:hypothetical protein K469DRAFT_755633 [Zopfia rhizophila CBS 207.26]
MPYDEEKDVVDDTSHRPSSSDDLEDCPLAGEQQRFPLRHRQRWPVRWFAQDSIAIHTNSTQCRKSLVPSSESRTNDPFEHYPHPADSWKKENLIEHRFYRDLRYMTLDHESDYLWQEHLLMATGNIRLPPPDGKRNATLKGIAMFHQMHCLAKMRMVLQLAREGVDIGVDWRDDAHWPHCFDYLRESILCYADPTLESVSLQPGPVDDGTFVKVIDGGAEAGYCRDSRPLYELDRQYGPNSQYGFGNDKDFEVAPGKY